MNYIYSCCGKYSKLKLNFEDTSIYKILNKHSIAKDFILVRFSDVKYLLQITYNTKDSGPEKDSKYSILD